MPVVWVHGRRNYAIASLPFCELLAVAIRPVDILLWEHDRVVHGHSISDRRQERCARDFAKPAVVIHVVVKEAAIEAREERAVENFLDPCLELPSLCGHILGARPLLECVQNAHHAVASPAVAGRPESCVLGLGADDVPPVEELVSFEDVAVEAALADDFSHEITIVFINGVVGH